jgi:hypothetical protein
MRGIRWLGRREEAMIDEICCVGADHNPLRGMTCGAEHTGLA